MNIIDINTNGILKYELEIWQGGYCSSLGKISVSDGKAFFDLSSLCTLRNRFTVLNSNSVTGRFISGLSYFRKIIEAKLISDSYLIDDTHLYIDADHIFINEKDECLFLPLKTDETFFNSFCKLAESLDLEILSEKLKAKNQTSLMSEKDILCFLSSWELELR